MESAPGWRARAGSMASPPPNPTYSGQRRAPDGLRRLQYSVFCSLFSHACFHTFWNRFLVDFPPNLAPKIHQNSIKNRSRDALYFGFYFWSIFGWFFLSISTTRNLKNLVFSLVLKGFFENPPFKINIDFWSNSDANLVPFLCQNPPKSIQKSIPKRITILIDFGIDFLKFLGSNLDPTWPPRRPKNRPRSPKIAQEAPKTAQGPPRTAPKTLSRHLQDRSGTCQNAQEWFSMIFGEFLMDFGTILRRILDDFWSNFQQSTR